MVVESAAEYLIGSKSQIAAIDSRVTDTFFGKKHHQEERDFCEHAECPSRDCTES